MNHSLLLGRLTAAPQLSTTPTGKSVTRFTIACNEPYVTADGEKKEVTSFVRCVVWGKNAETLGSLGQKGMLILALGRQTTKSYEKDGQKKYSTETVCNFVGMSFKGVAQLLAATTKPAAPGQSFADMGTQTTPEDLPF